MKMDRLLLQTMILETIIQLQVASKKRLFYSLRVNIDGITSFIDRKTVYYRIFLKYTGVHKSHKMIIF